MIGDLTYCIARIEWGFWIGWNRFLLTVAMVLLKNKND
jgi:hypothetical protein